MDWMFFVCVACASIKQKDWTLTLIPNILQKQKQHDIVMGTYTKYG